VRTVTNRIKQQSTESIEEIKKMANKSILPPVILGRTGECLPGASGRKAVIEFKEE
jgi:hypothetical protein